ncbi:flagella basal body P-ring formation protein FlgA [Bifidobacterium pullorum subsp. saeculare]|uniref:Flagella basal body P-ring formation protein FlgA n=1 Tax=Bifidobacterium pullorum subsp. saeculare TaxID=78257 RepID=A0A938WZQ4_9BIFI|nr:SAF domain-containing protein [Bifidobacterium pullorum]MBM6700013.1 flagella basal body P-ring formation protein FlgA [Bifidobacterium pullorum subsp. saeculare]
MAWFSMSSGRRRPAGSPDGGRQVPDGLRRRRMRAGLTRAAAAACAGLAVFLTLQCVLGTVETMPVVVATRALERGATIAAGDVAVARTPRSPAVEGAAHDDAAVVGMVAQTAVERGQPLYPTAIRASPVPPDGHTVLEVRVASDIAALTPGDHVSLASAMGCADAASASEAHAQGDAQGAAEPCVLTDRALVMARPSKDEDGGVGGMVSLAMPPGAALAVMATQEAGAIVAVTRSDG